MPTLQLLELQYFQLSKQTWIIIEWVSCFT